MKKFLSVMLVLGLVSTAFALPTITGSSTILPNTTETYTVVGVADDEATGGIFVDLATETYYASTLPSGITSINANLVLLEESTDVYRIGDVAGNFAYVEPYGSYVGIEFTSSAGTAGAVLAGGWFTFDLVVDGTIAEETVIRLDLTDATWTGQSYLDVTVVPEPMTIALLGLGGLFLRRRK